MRTCAPPAAADDRSSAARVGAMPDLAAIQDRLHVADSVDALVAAGAAEAAAAGGFARSMAVTVQDGSLVCATRCALADEASEHLRRRSLARPVPLSADCVEALVVLGAAGAQAATDRVPSALGDAFGLEDPVLAAVAPDRRVVAILAVDRPHRGYGQTDVGAVSLVAHLTRLALERLVLRLRLRELSAEFRHLTASAHALLHEVSEAPIGLTTELGACAVFPAAGLEHPGVGAGVLELLNERERAIAALMAVGHSNREIGEQLYLSPDTVKVHVARITRKLGAANRVDAVARYVAGTLAAPSAPPAGDRWSPRAGGEQYPIG